MQLTKAVRSIRRANRHVVAVASQRKAFHTSRQTKFLDDDDDIPENRDPNFLTKHDTFQMEWTDLRNRVFGDFGKPKAKPGPQRVSFVPDSQPFEEVTENPVLLDLPEHPIKPRERRITWPTPSHPVPRAVKTLPGGEAAVAVGRRKRATANVYLQPGNGTITVNGRHWMYYFKDFNVRNQVIAPLTVTEKLNQLNVTAHVSGGGVMGQAGAIRLGITRALLNMDPELYPPLKLADFVTRDSREVERKKPGQRKARRKFQWVKR